MKCYTTSVTTATTVARCYHSYDCCTMLPLSLTATLPLLVLKLIMLQLFSTATLPFTARWYYNITNNDCCTDPPEELLRRVTVFTRLAIDITVLCGDVSSSEKYALLSSPSLYNIQVICRDHDYETQTVTCWKIVMSD